MVFDELEELRHYVSQLEDENFRLKCSQKSLRNNNRSLLEGNQKLSRDVARLRKERDTLKARLNRLESDIS